MEKFLLSLSLQKRYLEHEFINTNIYQRLECEFMNKSMKSMSQKKNELKFKECCTCVIAGYSLAKLKILEPFANLLI